MKTIAALIALTAFAAGAQIRPKEMPDIVTVLGHEPELATPGLNYYYGRGAWGFNHSMSFVYDAGTFYLLTQMATHTKYLIPCDSIVDVQLDYKSKKVAIALTTKYEVHQIVLFLKLKYADSQAPAIIEKLRECASKKP